jgi:ABC-type branched-subunit amino acid transport system substrate-binding protein
MRPTPRAGAARAALVALVLVLAGAPARAAEAPPADARDADALAARAPSEARDRALAAWARRAPLEDLVWVLRRPVSELGGAEAALAAAALERAPAARADLRRRLRVRLAQADAKRARRIAGELAGDLDALAARPHASVFRLAVLLPDSGDYAAYGRALRAGIDAALAAQPAGAARRVEAMHLGTGDGTAGPLGAALDRAVARCGAAIGELLSVPTLALAAAARTTGLPLVSPTATDEDVTLLAPTAFQVGPSGHTRGAALARACLEDGPRRFGVLRSTDHERGSMATGFIEAARARGAQLVWNELYTPGTRSFRDLVRAMLGWRVEVLYWDGEPREADALIAEIARQRGSVRLVGGDALSPERYHGETRRLLEGVRVVSEDWSLTAPERAAVDSAVAAAGLAEGQGLATRGWIAARAVIDAVREGALSPAEVAAALARGVAAGDHDGPRRFLAGERRGLAIPVATVRNGQLLIE